MLGLDYEFELIRNPVLSSAVMWTFCDAYYEKQQKLRPVILPVAALVMPIIYHKESCEMIAKMQFASGINLAIKNNPCVIAGLQDRIEDYWDDTLTCIQVASAVNLIRTEHFEGWLALSPVAAKLPSSVIPCAGELRSMHAAAKRLAAWFSGVEASELARILRVNF